MIVYPFVPTDNLASLLEYNIVPIVLFCHLPIRFREATGIYKYMPVYKINHNAPKIDYTKIYYKKHKANIQK